MPTDTDFHVGIDPGKEGAVAIINPDTITVIDTPIVKVKSNKKTKTEFILSKMTEILDPLPRDRTNIYIEIVHSMPKQGVASQFNFGMGYGMWLGIIAALGWNPVKIRPQEWKKYQLQGYGKEKSASVVKAMELYPDLIYTTPRGRILDGRGDAVLIADYGMRKYAS